MKKYLAGLLAAYAATMTLLAVHWSAEAWVYRRCFGLLMQGKHGRPVSYPNVLAVYSDFSLDDGAWVYWYLRLADSGRALIGVVGLLFAAGLVLPKYLVRPRKGEKIVAALEEVRDAVRDGVPIEERSRVTTPKPAERPDRTDDGPATSGARA